MKTLHLIRHGKSSWADIRLEDKARPLKKRGLSDCQLMATELERVAGLSGNIYCSSAQRALQTIQTLSDNLPSAITWQVADELYTFDWRDLLYWLKGQSDQDTNIVIVGHNPALTELNQFLTGSDIRNLPTCGYLAIQLPNTQRWQEIKQHSGLLHQFITPKMQKG